MYDCCPSIWRRAHAQTPRRPNDLWKRSGRKTFITSFVFDNIITKEICTAIPTAPLRRWSLNSFGTTATVWHC
ncbi:hypothetical protein AV530_010697 [Patagioenas fasciata monilis]|uniref:Uncharacterized protein n=1 Tax=Patagioenas fasciata monilis TaxID=372326 RepID=A0A1V4K7K3_PATFA|nr:hypothetical protein AV530_010697 [Patagioenas fasciata monilis]